MVAVALLLAVVPATRLADAETAATAIRYDDAASAVGIDFRLAGEVHGPAGPFEIWGAFPEVMGSGACWLDYDGDGFEDLYLVNQRYNLNNPSTEGWAEDLDPRNKLYRNLGDGSFADVSADSGADSDRFGLGCSAADYDDDGDLDLFVGNLGDNQLLRNDAGVFVDVSDATGINPGPCGADPCMTVSTAWGDYDADGDLDLYVGNYVDTSLTDTRRMPEGHAGQYNFLMRNDGGHFTDMARAVGVAGLHEDSRHGSKTLGAVWFDADLDGDLDLYVANDISRNRFYVNHGGTFEDASEAAGLADLGASMGVTSGDYDQDGYPDLFFTHYAHEENGFYRNQGDLTFERRSGEDGLANRERLVGWGTSFVDLDRDGDLDLVAAFGHTEHFLDDYDQPTKFYYNEPGDGTPGDRLWVDRSAASGPGAAVKAVSRGAAFADYDLDGDTDIVLVNNANDTAQFLRADGVTNNWLTLLLRQPAPNIHAIGARVTVEAGGRAQTLELQAGSSYASQNSQRLDFGLADAPSADRITVIWPEGGISEYVDMAANQAIRIDRTLGVVMDTLSPVTRLVLNGNHDQYWWTTPVEVVLDAVDRNVGTPAGLDRVEYRLGDGPWQDYAGSLVLGETGSHQLSVRSVDRAGNWEPTRSLRVVIDVTAPSASHALEGEQGLDGWWVGPVAVQLSAKDDLSGVDVIRYSLNGAGWAPYTGPLRMDTSGHHHIAYQAIDLAGNEGPIMEEEIRIDLHAPGVRIDSPRAGMAYAGGTEFQVPFQTNAWVIRAGDPVDDGTHVVEVTASDEFSGVDRVVFKLDGHVQAVDAEAPYAWAWDVSKVPPGQYRVRVDAFDEAGNSLPRAIDVVVMHP